LADNHETRFPKYLSSPLQVLWLETDDLGIAVISFMLASIFKGWFWFLVIIGPVLYMRAKLRYPRGFLKHLLYLSGMKDLQEYPTTFQKEFLE
jgi:type IV conjugative transfer system protein TraL